MPAQLGSIVITDTGVWAATLTSKGHTWTVQETSFKAVQVPGGLMHNAGLDTLATVICEAAQQISLQSRAIRLLLPTHWLMTHTVTIPGKFNETAVRYEFESYLPDSLEEVTCALSPPTPSLRPGELSSIAVAVFNQPMESLLNALEKSGLRVHWLLPCLPPGDGPNRAHIWFDDHSLVFLVLDALARQPVLLTGVRSDDPVTTLKQQLSLIEMRFPNEIWTLSGRNACFLQQKLKADLPQQCQVGTEWAADNAPTDLLLPSKWDDQFNLRRQALEQPGYLGGLKRHVSHLAILLNVLLLVLIIGAWTRARQYRIGTEALDRETNALYGSVFPKQKGFAGAGLRLASERKHLEGLTRPDDTQTKSIIDATQLLREAVLNIPPQVRIKVEELRLDGRELIIRGQTASHRDAEQIATALRQAPHLEPKAPRSDALKEGGVAFSLRAEWKSEESPHHPGNRISSSNGRPTRATPEDKLP